MALLALSVAAYLAVKESGARAVLPRLGRDRRVSLLVLWPAIPVVVPFVLSLFVTPIYQFKYTIPAAVACYLLLALALEGVAPRIGLAAGAIVAAAFLVVTVRYYGDYETEGWRQAATYLSARAAPGRHDRVRLECREGRLRLLLAALGRSGGSREPARGPDEANLAAVRTASRSPGEVWLVVSHSRDAEGLIPAILDESRTQGEEADFVGIRVTPYE